MKYQGVNFTSKRTVEFLRLVKANVDSQYRCSIPSVSSRVYDIMRSSTVEYLLKSIFTDGKIEGKNVVRSEIKSILNIKS